jgi:16S rRNA (cytidine1402-2'-O)-methyltransferase
VSVEKGVLYVVATPIGNLGDVTERARRVLAEVDLVAAEDTRHTGRLLRHLGIDQRIVSLHEHNERAQVQGLLRRLDQGQALALVCDAGTPLISDPGYHLVGALREAGGRVVPVPGPSALTAALSVSGLPTDRFVFEGFLPARAKARCERLEALSSEPRTLVFYEAPHRLLETLRDMARAFGHQRHGVLARELTKLHETVLADTLAGLCGRVAADAEQRRGECVLLVRGAEPPRGDAVGPEARRVLEVLAAELPPAQAASLAARITGERRNRLYRLITQSDERGGA